MGENWGTKLALEDKAFNGQLTVILKLFCAESTVVPAAKFLILSNTIELSSMLGGSIKKEHVGAVKEGTLTCTAADVTASVVDPTVGKAVTFASKSFMLGLVVVLLPFKVYRITTETVRGKTKQLSIEMKALLRLAVQGALTLRNTASLKSTVTPFLVIVKGSLLLMPTGDSGVAITIHGVLWTSNLKPTSSTRSPLGVGIFVTVPF